MDEDTNLVFAPGNGNALTVADVDAGSGRVTTTLHVQHGRLTLGGMANVTVTGAGTGSVSLTGTLAAVNAALSGTTYRAEADYNGSDVLTVTTNDGGNTGAGGAMSVTDTIRLTVNPVNDAPRAGTLPAVGGVEGDIVAGLDLGRAFSDVEGETLTFGVAGLPAGLTVDSATGTVRGTIDRSASRGGTNGDYTVTVTADDGHGGTTRRSFTWRVVDPAPIARNDGAVTDARTPALGSVLADNGNGADIDPDGDPLTVAAVNGSAAGVGQAVTGSKGGRFTVLADGRYRFDPGADFADLTAGQTRTTHIAYTIDDGDGGTATAFLTVTVTGLTEAPAAFAPGDRAASDGETVVLPYGSRSRNPDGPALRYSATGLPPGLAIDPATGTIRGTIDRAASGATGLADYRVTITATDPGGTRTDTRFTFRVTNPAPVAMDDVATTAEDRPVVVDVLANDRDPDGDALAIAAAGDAAPRAGHGRVAIADGKLVYTPDTDFNGTDTITYAIVDGNGGTSTASVTVTVTPVSDGPSADLLPDQAGRGGTPVVYGIATYFHDPDTDRSAAAPPGDGGLRFAATGLPPGLAIDPATGWITGRLPVGSAASTDYAVTVTATDAADASIARSFTWTVTRAATAEPDSATTRAGTPVLVAVTANDSDADGGPVRLVDAPGATHAAHGTVSVDSATGLLTYVPEDGFSGTDTVDYTIETAQGVRATGVLTVTVTPVNLRPVAPETLSARNAADGESVRVPFGTLIADPEGERLAYTATGLPPGLAIDPATGEIRGTIARDASGSSGRATYVVTLTAADPDGLAVTRKFAWTITNPAPSAADDVITTDEDTPVDIDVTGNDRDPDGDPLFVVAGSATARHGTVAINPDGSLRYTPDPDFNGTDTIVYTITDGNGGFATASVAVGVNPVDDAPVIDAASPAGADRSASDAARVSIPAGSAFRDVDTGDILTFTATGLPPGLTVDRATGLISGTIASDASTRVPGGAYAVTLTGTDSAGASATMRFTITVGNPSPNALDDAATLDEDGILEGHVLDNDADPDGDAIRVDPTPVAGPLHGRLDLRPDGRFTYRPDADFHGEDAFTYAVIDADGGRATATVHLTVASIDAPPTANAAPVTTREDTPVDGRIVAHDRESESLLFAVEVPPASGSVALRPDGGFTYTPAADFHGGDGFTVRVSDGAGGSILVTVPVTIASVNDAPDAHADDLALSAGEVGRGRVVAADRDGDPLGFRLAGTPANGTVLLAEDGAYAYTPGPGFSGRDSFTVEVSDGSGGITRVTVAVTVAANRVLVPPPGAVVPIPGALPILEAPATRPALAPETGITADGFLLPAVTAIDPLGSIGKVILAKGAVVAAVNGVDDLHGTAIDIDHHVVLDVGDRIGRVAWERFEREPDGAGPWFSASPYLGRSLGLTLSMDETVANRNDFMIEAIRRPDALVINLHDRAPDVASVGNVRLLGSDGAPAPAWIEGDGRGGFWGRPPAGTRLLALEVEVTLRDGRVVRWPMTVDAETGEIRATTPARPGAGPKPVDPPEIGRRGEAPMFTAQLASLGRDGRPDFTLIEKALARAP
ncbi:Ig-like domain-containing protein [Methylobacterium terricola]|uniref:Ig-like domain-containing protein n=1 Tax=Methylobacterium terricola TaxID=2583531 RepID=UPI00197B8F6E|nr:Ig-like domain-containing protein [Methylobacterium terricola]